MDNSIIGKGIALGISFFILYSRKSKWLNPKIVWLICTGLFTFGSFGVLCTKTEFRNDRIMYFGFCVPIVYWIFDRIFKRISETIHQRDFILFLRNSGEIDNKLGAKNPHVEKSDKLFSIGLLIIIIGTLLLGTQAL